MSCSRVTTGCFVAPCCSVGGGGKAAIVASRAAGSERASFAPWGGPATLMDCHGRPLAAFSASPHNRHKWEGFLGVHSKPEGFLGRAAVHRTRNRRDRGGLELRAGHRRTD